ncbi:RDD family protein [Thalassomonas sp. RHCl1]|uniref:RDD family protein n=1 Tax=Thalassomonas sp. RHCl1 TaxID=2995320 RepID=UPI00248CF619|nr:RDD family protein [Thalassomonas sp. RHCl1]
MKQEQEQQPDGEANLQLAGTHAMTDSETRQVLTPFAFKMDHSLFGLPLATPKKRLLAIALDFLLVGALSVMPGEILALVVSVMLYRLGSKKQAQAGGQIKWRKTRSLARFIGVFILFVVLAGSLPELIGQFDEQKSQFTKDASKQETTLVNIGGVPVPKDKSLAMSAVVLAGSADIALSECQSLDCWQRELSETTAAIHELAVNDELFKQSLTGLAANTDLNEAQQKQLVLNLLTLYQGEFVGAKETRRGADNTGEKPVPEAVVEPAEPVKKAQESKAEKSVYSILELVKGIVDDLGLGFGWAAFYFTCFTAMWKGQTPGKKLFGIKVLQLDGTPLSMWDSFGRYGGYGAGIATGLLGFLQVYWDPNRQAIHDKISATVVIDLHRQQVR